MTISTTESSIVVSANGVTNSFAFPFIGVSSADITVTSIASNGIATPLLSSQYTLSLNAANPNQLWGVGGTVSFTSPPAVGTTLLIQRTLPLTQSTSVQNQGNYYAQVTEQALDTLCMEIQQVAARTTQFRGVWTTATTYNFGDIVQDGVNGAQTNNYYICTNANTSSVWVTDLANGDWAISVLATVPSQNLPITLSGAVSGSGTSSIVTGLTYTMAPNSVLVNSSATSGIPTGLSISSSNLVGRGSGGNVAAISLGSNLAMTGTVLSSTSTLLFTPLGLYSVILAEVSGGSAVTLGGSVSAANLTGPGWFTTSGAYNPSGDTLSGTWRAFQTTPNSEVSLFQRIA